MLSEAKIRRLQPQKKPYKVTDGQGLQLLVAPTGTKTWQVAYRFDGKQQKATLGRWPDLDVFEARRRLAEVRRQLEEGQNPSAKRREIIESQKRHRENTFERVARRWFETKKHTWETSYSKRIWSRIEGDLFPALGARPIAEITPPELLAVLRKVEDRNAISMAHRLKQMASSVFRFAAAEGLCISDPAQVLTGALKPEPRARSRAALPIKDLPDLLLELKRYKGDPRTALAIRLVLLTLVRTGELRGAQCSEFELDCGNPLWRIPEERMKTRKPHLVPLSKQAHHCVQELLDLRPRGSPLLVPGLSQNTMIYALYRMGFHSRATIHGFRATFSTWANESDHNPDVVERILAHEPGNAVRAAYNRAAMLEQRRELLQHWADCIQKWSGAIYTLGIETAA